MSSSLPLGHGGQYLYAENGPKSSCYSVNLHHGGLQQEPGPADGDQEDEHDQEFHHQHDLYDARAAKQ